MIDETGVLEVLEIKIFFAAQHGVQTFRESFKNSFGGFYTLVMASLVSFMMKISRQKHINVLHSSFYQHHGDSKS